MSIDINNIPERYEDLPQDELKLLLYYNNLRLQSTDNIYLQDFYQKKIEYISLLIKER